MTVLTQTNTASQKTNLLTEVIASLLDVDLLNKTEDLTQQLRDAAASAGWPTIVVIGLQVVVKNGEFDIDYPYELNETIEILEYGTETTPPNPVLRNFMKSIKKRVSF